MEIKVIKINTNKKLLQNLFDNMSKKLTKEEIAESIRTDFRHAGTTVSEIIIN